MICKQYNCGYKGKAKKSVYGDSYETCPKCGEEQLKKDFTVTLELSKSQANTLRIALESYSRMLIGQIDYALEPIRWNSKADWNEEVQPLLSEVAKKVFGFKSNHEFYGIYSEVVSDEARIAWDINQVLRNKMSWHINPKGGFTVNYDKPIKSSKEKLPECIIKEI